MSRTHRSVRLRAAAQRAHAASQRAARADLLVRIVLEALDTAQSLQASTARTAVDALRAMVPCPDARAAAAIAPLVVERFARTAGLQEVAALDFRRENGQDMTEPERVAWCRIELFASLVATAVAAGDLDAIETLCTPGAGPVAAS